MEAERELLQLKIKSNADVDQQKTSVETNKASVREDTPARKSADAEVEQWRKDLVKYERAQSKEKGNGSTKIYIILSL